VKWRVHAILLPLLGAAAALAVATCRSRPDATEAAERLPLAPLPELADEFSADRAYAHVEALVALGPRPPASAAFERQLEYLEEHLEQAGWTSHRQSFQAATPEGPTRFTNLLARFARAPAPPESQPILIGGHIDTKKLPFEFVGANDGGSSTGILLEIARTLATDPDAAARVELLFFDGEEAFRENISARDGLYGSKHFAHSLSTRPSWPALGIVIDIVGDGDFALTHNLDIPEALRPALARHAEAIGFPAGFRPYGGVILDDHLPLQQTGLPCLHLIGDFSSMPYWHQPGDTLEQVDAEMLGRVGRLTLRLLADPALAELD